MDASAFARHLLAERRPGFSLPQAFYTDAALFDIEIAHLFANTWLFAGHSCEIRQPGDYITYSLGRSEAIILRTADGGIRAFHNSCRHRGSRLCQQSQGHVQRLVCPYHQWTYDLEGQLLFAREMGADFDPADYPLKPVACEDVAGFLFVCFAPAPPDFAAVRDVIEPYIRPHGLDRAKIAHKTSIVEKGNWKLVWENNRECYHCPGSHPELSRTFSDAPVVTSIDASQSSHMLDEHWGRCEAAGLPSRFHIDPQGQWRVVRVPLLRDTESLTMSGQRASAKPLGGVAEPRIGSLLLYHYPTTWNHLLGDHAVTFQLVPLGPQQTGLITRWLVHEDAVEGVDYDRTALTDVWSATNDQDRRLVEQNQLGVNSLAYEPGPYSPIHEDGVIQFVNWYCAALASAIGACDAPAIAAE